MASYIKPLPAQDTRTQFYDNKRVERMLSEQTVPGHQSVTSEPDTEFDWKDYNFKNEQPAIDHKLLDSNSDMETWSHTPWERKYTVPDKTRQRQDSPRDLYVYYARDNASNSSTHSVRSSSQSMKPRQIRGILKTKTEAPLDETIVGDDNTCNINDNEPTQLETQKDPYDLNESIEAFNKYILEKTVRFEKSKSKKTKLRFLSRNQTIEKRADWHYSSPRNSIKDKDKSDFYSNSKLPPLRFNYTHLGNKTIQEFKKRNVNPNASKMVDIENEFFVNKPTASDCCSSSDDDDRDDDCGDNGVDGNKEEDVKEKEVVDEIIKQVQMGNKRTSVQLPGFNTMQRVKRAMSLTGNEAMFPLRRGSFKKAVLKVQKLIDRKRFKTLCREIDQDEDEVEEKKMTPLERLRHAVKLTIILLRAVGIRPEKPEDIDHNFLSWTILYDELGISRLSYDSTGLTFDPQMFKANRESFLSSEIRDILLKAPPLRTDFQIQAVIRFVSQVVPAFGEYPLRIQSSTLKCCTYEKFESGRVIIRQGHRAENFYFILSGTAVVTIMESGVNHVHTVNILSSGNSFGELAFLNMSQRTATVTCRDSMELLCIEREDFVKIFMRRFKDKEPEHVTFLKNVDVLKGWPIEKLPIDNLKICAFTYVRRGVTLCPDSSRSDWLFVIVSGTCKIIKALNDVSAVSDKPANKQGHGVSMLRCRFPRVLVTNSKSQNDPKADKRYFYVKPKSSRHNNRCMSSIATVINRPEEEVNQSRSEHATQLEDLYKRRHVLPSIAQHQKRKHGRQVEAEEKELLKATVRSVSFLSDQQRDGLDEGDDKVMDLEDDIPIPTLSTPEGTLTPVSPAVTPQPQTPDIHVIASTPSQFLRPATQNFGIHRSSLRPTDDALEPIAAVRRSWKNKQRQKPKVFIEVARLEPGDVFGLEHVVMNDMEEVTTTSLVSDGAEVVIIEKKFFCKHLTEETAKRIRQTIRPLPSDSVLQQNLVNQRHWDAYKSRTLETQAKHLIRSKLNQAFRA